MSETNRPGGQQPPRGESSWYGQRPGRAAQYGAPAPPGYGDTARVISGETSPILVRFADPAQQDRLTIAFRLPLAIPHLLVLWALGIAAQVIAIVGWFVALLTGQLPDRAHAFLTQVLRWQTRVYAYLFMLTDTYPPFALDDDYYPVRLLTRQTSLDRLAVLFRLVLAIPAAIVLAAANYGLAVLAFFIWLIALVTGELPTALHQAVATVVRYQARYGGYLYLVTSEYPWDGLYGDSLPASELDPPTDNGWRLQLSGNAKSLFTALLALGALAFGAQFIVSSSAVGKPVNYASALRHVEAANGVLVKNTQDFQSAIQTCNGQLSCVTGLLRTQAQHLETFDNQINGISLGGPATSDAARLVSQDNIEVQALNQLAAATSNAQYMNIVKTNSIQQDQESAEADYAKLVRDLGGVTT